MLNKKFEGILSKLNEKGGEQAFTQLSIKHSAQHPDFFDSLNRIFEMDHIKYLMEEPEKAKINLSLNIKVIVEFDEVEFDAVLVEAKMSKKEKKGEITFECEMKFEKDIDDKNNILGQAFLNHKEENAEGKMKLMLYNILVVKKEDK